MSEQQPALPLSSEGVEQIPSQKESLPARDQTCYPEGEGKESDNTITQDDRRLLLLLFDGNAIVHRAFHAIQPLTVHRTGEMVNAVYGFAATLLKVINEIKPTHWGIAFDRATPTFRHHIFEKYKMQRPPLPEELRSQIERVRQVADAFGIPRFEADGFEADDVIATIATQASNLGIDTIIVTGDADMLQLVSPKVRVLYPKRSFSEPVMFDEATVQEKYGLAPTQLTELKAIVGDISDNIPNIKGIGEKTAIKLLRQFGNLEGIYRNLDQISPERIRNALMNNRDQVFRSRELATLIRNIPGISLNLDTCRVTTYNRDAVIAIFRELEFAGLIKRLPHQLSHPSSSKVSAPLELKCRVINSEPELQELVTKLSNSSRFALEVITSGKSAVTSSLVGLSLAIEPGETFYIPIEHHTTESSPQLTPAAVLDRLRPVLESESPGKSSSNAKQVLISLSRFGVALSGMDFDTSIAAYCLGEKATSLASLAFNRLGMELPSSPETDGAKQRAKPITSTPIKEVAHYAGSLANAVRMLEPVLRASLESHNLLRLFAEIEMPLVPVLAEMEMNGLALDTDLLRRLSEEIGREISKLQDQIYQLTGTVFNINSPQQLAKVLFEHLKLPPPKRTRDGYSTDATVLEELRKKYPATITPIIEYRQLTKLKSTFLDVLPTLVNPATGRIHTSFNQTVTATGRLSSSNPNLQNIPVRGDLGRKIRQAFIAPAGKILITADYSQIDLRVLAHLSQDPTLIDAFINDQDIHAMTASQVFDVPLSEVTSEMRRVAKTVNFGVIYGMTDYGLEQATDLTREEATRFIETYFKRYPKVKEYLESVREQARRLGYVETLAGRRRYLSDINSTNRLVREAAERMAINMPVQGTSADIIKIAMVNLHRAMKRQKMTSLMILQVHDELLFEAPHEEKELLMGLISNIMPAAMKLSVPLKIDIKQGHNWGQMQ